jgi:hypothetical protein
MNHDALLATGLQRIPVVREFCDLFPNAEHTVGMAKRDFDGWQVVHEWISRSPVFERYVVWLIMAICVEPDGNLTELEMPNVYIVEINNIERCRNDRGGPSWEFSWAEFEDGDWERLVENRGDFAAVGLELTPNDPVERFTECYEDTRPIPLAEPPDGMAFKAPLRYMLS